MSIKEANEKIQRAKQIQEISDLLNRETQVTIESALKLFSVQLKGLEYNPDDSKLKYIFDTKAKYDDYYHKGIKFTAFYDKETDSVEFRTVH